MADGPGREACGAGDGDAREAGDRGQLRRQGLVEAAAALLATIVFGLGWAALELGQVEAPGSGYDPAPSLQPEDDPWMNETLYERAARSSNR